MNGKRAKKIRQEVYGDLSHRLRKYKTMIRAGKFINSTIVNVGIRKTYLNAKKDYKLNRSLKCL